MKDVSELSDQELEAAWQASATEIGQFAMKSWHCKPEQEEMYRKLAEAAQEAQQVIQVEITKRGRTAC